MEPSFCLLADILGFRSLIATSEDAYHSALVDDWVRLVDTTMEANRIATYQLISDSLFVVAPQTLDGLVSILGASTMLLTEALRMHLPLRGGIARGHVRWGERITHGPAIVAAYELESHSDWIGICCQFAFPELASLWGYDSVFVYPTPMKRGQSIARPCVAWDIPSYTELKRLVEPRDGAGHQLPDAVITKLRNTDAFRSYQLPGQARHLESPRRFNGSQL